MAWWRWLAALARPKLLKLLGDPQYRLESSAEVALAARLGLAIDVNRASVDDWLRLPGLSIRQAHTLVNLTRAGVQLHCIEDVAAAIGTSVEQLQPLAPALRFCFYDAALSEIPLRLDPNQANVEALACLPGLDHTVARAIVKDREQSGPYRDLADLQQRLHLPSELTADLLHYLQFQR